MKPTPILLSLAAGLALATSANAMLIVGYHSFNADTNDESPDYVASGISSSIAKLGRPGNALGGSNDSTFGPATFSELTPGTNDGYLRVFAEGQPILTVINNQAAALPLANLYFDAASQNTGSQVAVSYSINGSPTWVNLFTSPDLTDSGSTDASVNYDDFSINLSSIVLASGDSIQPVAAFASTTSPSPRSPNRPTRWRWRCC
jgi:hypothetical protein